MTDNGSAELIPLVSREQAENAFRDALSLYVGGKRRYSVKQLAKGIRLLKSDGEPNTKPLYDFLSYPSGHPDQRPLNFGVIVAITKFLGAEFTNEWLPLANQGAFDLPDEEPDPGDLAADTSDDTATIVRAAVDRKFDCSEKPKLREVGARMMTRGAQLVAVGGRP